MYGNKLVVCVSVPSILPAISGFGEHNVFLKCFRGLRVHKIHLLSPHIHSKSKLQGSSVTYTTHMIYRLNDISVMPQPETYEPRREKTGFLGNAHAKTKAQISFTVPVKLIGAFVFATQIVQSLFFLNPKFQASSLLLY